MATVLLGGLVGGGGFRVFFGFLWVFGGVFTCGCLIPYYSEERYFRSFSEKMVGTAWMGYYFLSPYS